MKTHSGKERNTDMFHLYCLLFFGAKRISATAITEVINISSNQGTLVYQDDLSASDVDVFSEHRRIFNFTFMNNPFVSAGGKVKLWINYKEF